MDAMHHLATMQLALEKNPTGEVSNWSNPENGTGGAVIPTEKFKKSSGGWCSKYDYHIMHDTKVSSGKGIACRDNHGEWKPIGTPPLSTL